MVKDNFNDRMEEFLLENEEMGNNMVKELILIRMELKRTESGAKESELGGLRKRKIDIVDIL